MKQYKKKPVTIEAVQFDGLNLTEIKDFVGDNCDVEIYDNWVTPPVARVIIHTLEGDMEVSKGDYVIKGVKGEFYPCKPDIFQQTYESTETQKKLEEAAEEFAEGEWDGAAVDTDGNPLYAQDEIEYAFKAGAEWQAEQGHSVSEDFIAARDNANYNEPHSTNAYIAFEEGFTKGAEWQRRKDNLEYDDIFYKGMMYYRKQMMEEAVEGIVEDVSFNNGEKHNTIRFSFDEESLHSESRMWFPRCGKDGDKVKIIIVKEDGQDKL